MNAASSDMGAAAVCVGNQGKTHLGMPRWAGHGARRRGRPAFSKRRQRCEASSCAGCALRSHTRQQECHLADAGSTGPPSPTLLPACGCSFTPQVCRLSVTQLSASCSRPTVPPSASACPEQRPGTPDTFNNCSVCCRVPIIEALYPLCWTLVRQLLIYSYPEPASA